jgi:type VI secretion system protein ImpB
MSNLKTAQHWIDRNRRPRVQITYDVQDNGATVKQELPFIVGVLANLQGDESTDPNAKKLRDRKFIAIDQDSFDDVFGKLSPTLTLDFAADDPAAKNLGQVHLKFGSLKDLEPFRVANQVGSIKELLDQRKKLVELLAKLSLNPALSTQLGRYLAGPDPAPLAALKGDVKPPNGSTGQTAGTGTAAATGTGTAAATGTGTAAATGTTTGSVEPAKAASGGGSTPVAEAHDTPATATGTVEPAKAASGGDTAPATDVSGNPGGGH